MSESNRVWLCDLCHQPLERGELCNSGIHQGPDDPNGWKGRATEYVKADCEWTEMVDHHMQARAQLEADRDRFRLALGVLAELSPPHTMERYRKLLREREGRA